MLKILLKPFNLIFWGITALRNNLYDKGYLRSFEFTLPVINVGNLRVGGTGKTPMVEYLVRKLLAENFHPAIISRGYGRKTKGFRLATASDTAHTIGDEPLQYFTNFGENVPVTVGEDRLLAIPELLTAKEDVNVIVLDDAFQHRRVQAGFNIVLSAYEDPFFSDDLLPGGRLRESASGLGRADVVIFTKCPDFVADQDRQEYIAHVHREAKKPLPVFFTKINYGTPQILFGDSGTLLKKSRVVLVSGLADDRWFVKHIAAEFTIVEKFSFPDHHAYTKKDILHLQQKLKTHAGCQLVTTAKDATKLREFADQLEAFSCYYVPIEIVFLQEEDKFLELLQNSIHQYH